MSTAKRLTPNKIANLVMADEAWHDSEYVAASDYDALSAELAAERERADKAEAEVARLNKWADGMTDAVLKERETGDMYQRELRAERDALRAELAALRAERDALRAEVELWKERAYQLSHA